MTGTRRRIISSVRTEVGQSNRLIQARKNFDLLGMRLFILALKTLNPHFSEKDKYFDTDFKESFIPMTKLLELLGGSKYLGMIDETCKKVLNATVNLGFGGGTTRPLKLFEKLEYEPRKGLCFLFSQDMRPHLLDLHKSKGFTMIDSQYLLKLSSPYAIRLLELFLQFKNIIYFKDALEIRRQLTVKQLRFMLNVPEDAYVDRIDNFKRHVLDIPIREINERTPYKIRYKTVRKGRFVYAIKFFVDTFEVPNDIEKRKRPRFSNDAIDRLHSMGFTDGAARSIFFKCKNVEDCFERIVRAEIILQRQPGLVRNRLGFLRKAIEENWEVHFAKEGLYYLDYSDKEELARLRDERKNAAPVEEPKPRRRRRKRLDDPYIRPTPEELAKSPVEELDEEALRKQEELELQEEERWQKEQLEREQLERERLERERLERERLERERLERERLERERLERERLEREQLERERLERERLERERLERERLQKELEELERVKQERLEQEQFERERLQKELEKLERVKQERLEQEQFERERLQKELEKLERHEGDHLAKQSTEQPIEQSDEPSATELKSAVDEVDVQPAELRDEQSDDPVVEQPIAEHKNTPFESVEEKMRTRCIPPPPEDLVKSPVEELDEEAVKKIDELENAQRNDLVAKQSDKQPAANSESNNEWEEAERQEEEAKLTRKRYELEQQATNRRARDKAASNGASSMSDTIADIVSGWKIPQEMKDKILSKKKIKKPFELKVPLRPEYIVLNDKIFSEMMAYNIAQTLYDENPELSRSARERLASFFLTENRFREIYEEYWGPFPKEIDIENDGYYQFADAELCQICNFSTDEPNPEPGEPLGPRALLIKGNEITRGLINYLARIFRLEKPRFRKLRDKLFFRYHITPEEFEQIYNFYYGEIPEPPDIPDLPGLRSIARPILPEPPHEAGENSGPRYLLVKGRYKLSRIMIMTSSASILSDKLSFQELIKTQLDMLHMSIDELLFVHEEYYGPLPPPNNPYRAVHLPSSPAEIPPTDNIPVITTLYSMDFNRKFNNTKSTEPDSVAKNSTAGNSTDSNETKIPEPTDTRNVLILPKQESNSQKKFDDNTTLILNGKELPCKYIKAFVKDLQTQDPRTVEDRANILNFYKVTAEEFLEMYREHIEPYL